MTGIEDQRTAWAEDARTRFENRYERLPQWEIGRAQPALAALEERGWIGQRLLDAGCGTGDNALHFAGLGRDVWGIDISDTAIGMARAKARERGQPPARFLVGDALTLEELGLRFDTVIDSGLFHAMRDAEQLAYARSVACVLEPGGMLHVLCFSEHQPGVDGPRRVRRGEIEAVFTTGWRIEEIVRVRFETNIHPGGAHAYRASLRWLSRVDGAE